MKWLNTAACRMLKQQKYTFFASSVCCEAVYTCKLEYLARIGLCWVRMELCMAPASMPAAGCVYIPGCICGVRLGASSGLALHCAGSATGRPAVQRCTGCQSACPWLGSAGAAPAGAAARWGAALQVARAECAASTWPCWRQPGCRLEV